MKKYSIKKMLTWVFVNSILLLLFYYGLVEQNNSFLNVVKFFVWFNFASVILYFIAMSYDVNKAKLKEKMKSRSVPDLVNLLFGIMTAFALAYYGHFVYASVDIVTTIMQISIFQIMFDEKTT